MSRQNFFISAVAALTVAFHATAQDQVIIDSENNRNMVEDTLAAACTSTMSKQVLNCTATQMESTRALSEALDTYLSGNAPNPVASEKLYLDCAANFRAIDSQFEQTQITESYEAAVAQYFEYGFRGSLKCLQTIESVSAAYNIDYMPSVRDILHDMIDNARNGRIIPRISI